MYDYEFNADNKLEVEEEVSGYDKNRDFTTLEAWKNSREVKLYFYNKILPKLPEKEKYNLDIQIRKALLAQLITLPKDMGDIIIRRECNFIEYQELHYMN